MTAQKHSEPPNELRYGCCGVGMFFIILFIFLLSLFCSCTTTKYIPIKGDTHTEYISMLQKDSIYLRDSIYIRERGDTIFYERWNTKYIERLRIDSFLQRDSIAVPYEVLKEVPVEKKLSWWQSLKQEIGGICLGAIILLIAYLGIKVYNSGWSILKTIFKL